MKTKFLVLLLALTLGLQLSTSACSQCGCGAGGYYLGLMPLFNKNFVGMRYRTSSFTSHADGNSDYNRLTEQKDAFTTVELIGRYYPTRRLQLTTFIPYQIHQQQTASPAATHQTGGIGDVLVMASYNLFSNLGDTNAPLLRHGLWVGVGLKTATGHYEKQSAADQNAGKPNYLLGTGSWDPMLTATYMVRRNRTGLSLDVSARYATLNKQDYAFGNRITSTLSLYTIRQQAGWGFMPNVSLYAEATGQDYDLTKGRHVAQTGGTLVCGQAGLDVLVGTCTFGGLASVPMAQHLGGGLQSAQSRWLLHVGYAF